VKRRQRRGRWIFCERLNSGVRSRSRLRRRDAVPQTIATRVRGPAGTSRLQSRISLGWARWAGLGWAGLCCAGLLLAGDISNSWGTRERGVRRTREHRPSGQNGKGWMWMGMVNGTARGSLVHAHSLPVRCKNRLLLSTPGHWPMKPRAGMASESAVLEHQGLTRLAAHPGILTSCSSSLLLELSSVICATQPQTDPRRVTSSNLLIR